MTQTKPDRSRPQYIEEGSHGEIEPIDTRIYGASKRIYKVATTILFGQNIIRIELIGPEYLILPSPIFRTGFLPTCKYLVGKLKSVEFDIGPARQCNWALRRRRRQLADRATLPGFEINAFGAWGADTDEVDNSTEMAMLGSPAQRDRMYRDMTTLSLHSRHDHIGLISRRLSTRAETCGTSFARKESHGFASLMCVWDRLTITSRPESCHLQLDAFFCGNASSARPVGSCCFQTD